MTMTTEQATELAKRLAQAVDAKLRQQHDLAKVTDSQGASDGQIAVMVIFQELERRGLILVRASTLQDWVDRVKSVQIALDASDLQDLSEDILRVVG